MCHSQKKTKKVYREHHAERKTKAYKRDKSNNHYNPAYVQNNSYECGEEDSWQYSLRV